MYCSPESNTQNVKAAKRARLNPQVSPQDADMSVFSPTCFTSSGSSTSRGRVRTVTPLDQFEEFEEHLRAPAGRAVQEYVSDEDYDELMYEAIGLGRGRGGELRRRLAPENEKDEREAIGLGRRRGHRLAGARAVPEDDIDDREEVIALGRGRRLAGAWAVPEDDMDEREEEEQGAGSGMLQLNSDEKESEKVVYVIVAICLLGFVQEHLGGGC